VSKWWALAIGSDGKLSRILVWRRLTSMSALARSTGVCRYVVQRELVSCSAVNTSWRFCGLTWVKPLSPSLG